MKLEERKQRLKELREEFKSGTRSKLAITLEGRALSRSIEIAEKKNNYEKLS